MALYLYKLKIARPGSSQNFMDTAKTIDYDSFVYTNKQYSNFFQSYTHQTYKEFQNKNMSTVTVTVTPCFVSQGFADNDLTFIVEQSN